MTEIVKGDMTPEQIKKAPDMQTLVDQALVDEHLSEAEGMEIMIRLKIGKDMIHKDTKSKLSAFLEENGQNWNGSLGKELQNTVVTSAIQPPVQIAATPIPAVENPQKAETVTSFMDVNTLGNAHKSDPYQTSLSKKWDSDA